MTASMISVRMLQALLGIVYMLLGCIAVARSPSFATAVVAAGVMLVSYRTSRPVVDAFVSAQKVLGVCVVGLIVVVTGIVADAVGGRDTLRWATIVMAYCAGNRLKAGGIALADEKRRK